MGKTGIKSRCQVAAVALLALLCVLAGTQQAAAQRYLHRAQQGHRVFVWVGGGYSRLNLYLNDVPTLGYVGGTLAGGYSYAFNKRWAVSTGVEFSLLGSSTKPVGINTEYSMIDTEGDAFTMLYSFNRHRERHNARYVNLPLSVEYSSGKYYYTAGVKAGMSLGAATAATTVETMKTAGEYDIYLGHYEAMPNHFFTSKPVESENSIELGINVMASAEVGRNFMKSRQRDYLKVALFCDYGLLNIQKNSGKELLSYERNDPTNVHVNSLADVMSNRVTSLMVGVKLVVFLKSPNEKDAYPCLCKD